MRLLRDNLGVAAGNRLSRGSPGSAPARGAVRRRWGRRLRDAYMLANNTPNIIYELILGGILTATLVPLFTEQLEQDDDEGTVGGRVGGDRRARRPHAARRSSSPRC